MGLFRRFPAPPPQLQPLVKPLSSKDLKEGKDSPPNAGLWTEESLAALQRFLRDLWSTVEGGLPAGQAKVAPPQIKAGDAADVGSPEMGWATGSHKHSILTSSATSLTPISTSTEGAGTALARADHTHDMSRVEADVMSKISLGF